MIDPAYTSKTCHVCGTIGSRNGKHFECSSCGWSGDADFNCAGNIAFLGLRLGQPGGSDLPSLRHSSGLPESLSPLGGAGSLPADR